MRFALVIALAVSASFCLAEDTPDSIDKLQHKRLTLPDGKYIDLVFLKNDLPYRLATPEILQDHVTAADAICFEARFMALTPDSKLKLMNTDGILIASDPHVLRKAKELKCGDSVSCFGTLRLNGEGKSAELMLSELFKEATDLQRCRNGLAELEKRAASAAMKPGELELLAQEFIDQGTHAVRAGNQSFMAAQDSFALNALANSAFLRGLDLKEHAITASHPEDAEGYFALAYLYHELLPANQFKFRNLIERCLELNADHAAAGRIAEQQFNLKKFEGRWMSAQKMQETLDARKRAQSDLEQLHAEHVLALQKRIAAERPQLTARLASDLASTDSARAKAALDFCAEILDEAPDIGAPLLNSISEVDHPNALAALRLACRAPSESIRGLGYEALVWRANRAQERDQSLEWLCDALKVETKPEVAQTGVDALVAAANKPAIGALVCSLSTHNAAIRSEIIIGLKTATHETFSTPDGWVAWWKDQQ